MNEVGDFHRLLRLPSLGVGLEVEVVLAIRGSGYCDVAHPSALITSLSIRFERPSRVLSPQQMSKCWITVVSSFFSSLFLCFSFFVSLLCLLCGPSPTTT